MQDSRQLGVSEADVPRLLLPQFEDDVAQGEEALVDVVAFSLASTAAAVYSFRTGQVYQIDLGCADEFPSRLDVLLADLDVDSEHRMRPAGLVVLLVVSNPLQVVALLQIAIHFLEAVDFEL